MDEPKEAQRPSSVIDQLLMAHPGMVLTEDPDTLIGRMLAASRKQPHQS